MRISKQPRVFTAPAWFLTLGATWMTALPAAAQTSPPSGPRQLLASQTSLPPTPATSLVLPQSNAFAILGHSCGGIHEHAYVTGFDPGSGYPVGAVKLTTTCSAGGIGGNTITYTAWAGVTWDFGAHAIYATALPSAPPVNSTFVAYDAYGDFIYNTGTAAYLWVPLPHAPIGVTAVQSADEFDVSWTPAGVNPSAVASTTLTATPVNSTAPILIAAVVGSAANGVIPTLEPQTTYQITVVNGTLNGNGPASAPILVTTSPPTIPPGAPTALTAVWTNQNPIGPTDTLIANWHAAVPGNSPIDQYFIQVVDTDANATHTQTVTGTTLSASFTVEWKPNWAIKVKAHNAAGWGPWSGVFTLGGL